MRLLSFVLSKDNEGEAVVRFELEPRDYARLGVEYRRNTVGFVTIWSPPLDSEVLHGNSQEPAGRPEDTGEQFHLEDCPNFN